MITRVTGKNQVTIPAAIARMQSIHPGTRLDWRTGEEGDVLIVKILPDRASLASSVQGRGARHVAPSTTDTVGDLVRERERDDALRQDDLR